MEELQNIKCYKRRFTKAWLLFLALSAHSVAQHKLILKHLSEYVMPAISRPILLADYLTSCYNKGGVLAVLALESLFVLIVHHNLDYPHYFESLYRLCTLTVFSAKYRTKFMTLLSHSLQSVNLTSYTVAAFIKRLLRVAIHAPSTSALFCLAQVTWLLRQHPQCHVLIHRFPAEDRGNAISSVVKPAAHGVSEVLEGGGVGKEDSDPYDPREDRDLERTQALHSSCWELEVLLRHHVHSVGVLVRALQQDPSSTATNSAAAPLRVADFMQQDYSTLITSELKKAKKFGAQAYREPTHLLGSSGSL
eukprot:gene1938-2289_t